MGGEILDVGSLYRLLGFLWNMIKIPFRIGVSIYKRWGIVGLFVYLMLVVVLVASFNRPNLSPTANANQNPDVNISPRSSPHSHPSLGPSPLVERLSVDATMRPLTELDLQGLSRQQLRLLRNEIFARHGYIFKSEDLRDYFFHQNWYQPKYTNISYLSLNQLEKKNIEFIQARE